MPQAIAFAAAYAASNTAAAIGATVATQAVVASTAAAIAPLAIGIGASLAASALLAPNVAVPKPSDGQQEVQQPVPPRMFHYGRMKVSGPLAFLESIPSSGKAGKIILLSAREIDAIEQQWLDDRLLVFDGLGNTTNAFNTSSANAFIATYLGTDAQTADPTLVSLFPEIWTADHRLRGIAYAVFVADDASAANQGEAFPNGLPNYKALIRGAKVWDLRSGAQTFADRTTHLWSDNPILCVLDWLTHPDGYDLPLSKIHLASFIARANMCDEIVPLAGGGSEKRYRVATTVYLNEPRKEVLKRLLDACDCRIYQTADEKIGVRGGSWFAPAVLLTTDAPANIIDWDFTNGVSALGRYNELSIRYMSPDHGYTEVEADPWVNQADIDDYGVLPQSLDLSQVPSHTQVRRLTKIIMARDNAPWSGSIRTNFAGLNAIGEQRIGLASAEINGGTDSFNGPYWVGEMTIQEDVTGAVIDARFADEDSFDWSTAEEGTPPAVPPGDIEFTDGSAPDPVTGLSATGTSRKATISWTAPVDPEFAAARVWRSTTTDFDDAVDVSGPIAMPLEADGDPALTVMTHTDPAVAGTYQYWVTAENAVGDRGAPVGPDPATVT